MGLVLFSGKRMCFILFFCNHRLFVGRLLQGTELTEALTTPCFFGRQRQVSLLATGNRETKGREIACSVLAQQNVSWQPNIGFAGQAVLLTQVVSRRLQMERGQRIVDQRLPKSHIFSREQISLFCLFRRAPVEAESVPSLPYCTRFLL